MRPTVVLAVALLGCGDGGGRAADAGGDGPGGDPDAAVAPIDLFDESVIRTYELDVAPADLAYLNEDPTREAYVSASLRLGDETFAAAAVRYKGGYGSLRFCFDAQGNQVCDKLSLKIAFDQVDPDGRFHGQRKVNLHSMAADPTRMHDAISYKLYRDHGVPAPRTAYARVVLNGDLQGLFAVVEQIDGRFTRARFPDGGEGNLYKEVWPQHLTAQPYLDALETNRDEAPSADRMLRFAQALADGGDAGFADVIDAWMDPGQLVRYLAVGRLIDGWDDVIGWYCPFGPCFNHNYFWYESTTEDRVWLIAWDTDHTFEEPSPIRETYGMPDWDDVAADCAPRTVFLGISARAPACDPFIRRIATELWDGYAAESQLLLDGAFSLASLNARIDGLAALLAGAVAEDPNGAGLVAWQQAVSALRTIIVAKRDHVAAKL